MLGKQSSKMYVFIPTLDNVLRKYFPEITRTSMCLELHSICSYFFIGVRVINNKTNSSLSVPL
jgi:hypothetical protein